MDSDHPFEISSDEDIGYEHHQENELDWLSELFDKEEEGDDEVIVLSETKPQSHHQTNNNINKPPPPFDDDDECLILDGDPDKPAEVSNDTGNGSDELLIVGEKGQIACRDYAHSRHLCARFPFSSTHHAKYCDLCHCYVCDSPAPCIYWGTGVSNGDHCHSTDKEDVWRIQRKCFKQNKIVAAPAAHEAALSMAPALPKSGPTFNPPSQPPLSNGPLYSFNSHPLRACPSSTNGYGLPNIISPRNHQQRPGYRVPHHLNRLQVAPGSSYTTVSPVRRDRNGGGCFVPPYTSFKKVGPGGVGLGKNRPGQGYYYDKNRYLAQEAESRNHYSFVGIDSLQNACTAAAAAAAAAPNKLGTGFVDHHQGGYNVCLQPPPAVCYRQQSSEYVAGALDPNYDLHWLKDSNGESGERCFQPQSMSEAPPQEVPAASGPGTDFDLDSWIESLEQHHQPDLGPAKDTVSSVFSFASHQEELANENMLLFEFEKHV